MTSAIYQAHVTGQTWKNPGHHRSDAHRIVERRVSQGGGHYIFYIARDTGRILSINLIEPERWDFPIPPERLRIIRALARR